MNEFLDSIVRILPPLAFGLCVAIGILFAAKAYIKHNVVIAFFNSLIMRVFANVLGVALICVSAFLNVGFVVGVGRGYPEATHIIPYLATLAGAVNLAAPLAVIVAWAAYKKKQHTLACVAGAAYFLILMFSLTTGSTVIHTSSNNINHQRGNADLITQTKQAQVANNKAQMQQALTTANPEALALGATTMKNANGVSVSVARYCKQGNWYFNNRTACRDYLSAQQSTAALAGVTTLRQANNKLMDEALQAQLNKPTPMLPKFLGFDVPENIMFSLCILVLEIAALVAFLYGRTTAPSEDKEITVRQVQTELDLAETNRQTTPVQSRSKGKQSARSGNPKNLLKPTKAPPLKEQELCYRTAIGKVQPEGQISNELLEDLLYQLAAYNPNAVLTADAVIQLIADHRDGVSVGKERILKLISSDQMSDIVLTNGSKKPKVYSFKPQETSSNVRSTQQSGASGLPAGQSALSQHGMENPGHRESA